MLDAGRAKKQTRDPHIKHITHFEPTSICKLLNSPDYLGRAYSCKHKNPEKYIKNKQICKLIDDIRYQTGLNGKDCRNKHAAKLHYKGFIHTHLDGGQARTLYKFADKLDLGDAGPECYEGLIPAQSNLQETTCELRYNSAHLHYKEFNQPNLDGGIARSSYTSANKLNFGDAGAECHEPFVPCNNLEETRQSANLQYEGFIDPNLDGGSAKSSYTLANKLDLGDAGDESLVLCNDPYSYANLHYKGYTHSNLDGGNAKSSYSLANKLNLGDAGDESLVSCNTLDKSDQYANIQYKGFIHSNVDGGLANTSYTSVDKLDLGTSGIESNKPVFNTTESHHSANLHYKDFHDSHLNGGNASSLYTSADKLDLGGAQLVKSY
jgi:hypothetical protein